MMFRPGKLVLMILGLIQLTCTGSYDTWYSLFDGESLANWKASENTQTWQVEDSALVCRGPRSHLFYDGEVNKYVFRNFEFSADVKTTPGSNSGIYIHTEFQAEGWPSKGYECQVHNSSRVTEAGEYVEHKLTGSLYAVRNLWKTPARDDQWFNYRIQVMGKTIRVYIDDQLMVEYTEPEKTFRPEDKKGRLLDRGTFALQGHDSQSVVFYRNLKVRPLPFETETPGTPQPDPELERKIVQLSNDNFPLLDLHVHLKNGLTEEEALLNARKFGYSYGFAVNCGRDTKLETNEQVEAFLAGYSQPPNTWLALQAEGREWTKTFSPETIAKFDYVFTDALTWTNKQGKRMRLWKKDEVKIGDPQDFMNQLVDQTVQIITDEPIDILVNPTYLPEEISADYDALWTENRIDRVVKALAGKGVALEINDRFRIPSPEVISRAKAAGVRFTFGTNNSSAKDLGHLAYCLEMVDACGLEPGDMWIPE